MEEQEKNSEREYEPPYDMLSEDVFEHLVEKGPNGVTDAEFAWMVKSRGDIFKKKMEDGLH